MTRPLRILVLEDSAVEAELCLRELRRAGFEPDWRRVETEADFLAALEPPPDLILADYSLPHFDGLSALKQLRERRLDIPYILISGKLGEEAAVEAMKQGASDYLLKDRIERLGDIVERALAEQRLRTGKREAEDSSREANARLQAANEELRAARVAALNLMEDALLARQQTEQAAQALRESQARLATFAGATFEGIVESEGGRIVDCNEQFARMVGNSVAGLKGVEIATLIAPEDRDRVMAKIREGRELVIEHSLLRQDGMRIITEAHGAPVSPGSLRHHTAIRNITERKLAEVELRQARDLLEQRVQERTRELNWANTALRGEKAFSDSLIELAPAVIVLLDRQGNLIRTNAYAEQLSGHPFAETQGRDMIKMFVPKPEHARMRQLLGEAMQGRLTQRVVAPLRTRDGSIRHIEWFTKPIANAASEFTAVLAIGHDITDRLHADEALRRSEHHLSNFFNQAPIGLVWLSASGTILRANQAQLDMVGRAAAEYVGHSFMEFCPEESHGRELLKRLAAREIVRNLRMTRRRKDGSILHVLVDANSSWNGKKFEYSSVFVRDITDRIKLEQEILHVSEQEQRRIAQDLHDGLGQLLAGAAYLAGTARQDLAAKSRPEARKLGRIWEVLNEALAMTRNLARGLHPVDPEPNGLMVALENLAARTQKLFQVRCRFHCRRPVPVRDGMAATHLYRIAQEAVTNAIKHGHPGRIEISLTTTPNRLMLAVKDDGSGLPARQRKPAGMGLRIMRYRAGVIGGSLGIQKEAGGGTTVVCTVHLPDPSGPQHEPKNAVAAEVRRRTRQTKTSAAAEVRRRTAQVKAAGGKSKPVRNQTKHLRKK